MEYNGLDLHKRMQKRGGKLLDKKPTILLPTTRRSHTCWGCCISLFYSAYVQWSPPLESSTMRSEKNGQGEMPSSSSASAHTRDLHPLLLEMNISYKYCQSWGDCYSLSQRRWENLLPLLDGETSDKRVADASDSTVPKKESSPFPATTKTNWDRLQHFLWLALRQSFLELNTA